MADIYQIPESSGGTPQFTIPIGGFYGVDPKSEEAAYLQGEMSRKMFPAVALAVCPKCIGEKEEE